MLKHSPLNTFIIPVLGFSLFASGCTESKSSLGEKELKDLSEHAVGMNFSNRFDYYPLIEEKIPQSPNPELHQDVLEIAMVIDTLAMKYMEQTGGIAENGTLMNPTMGGEKGIDIYNELHVKDKLRDLLNKAKEHASSSDKSLLQRTEWIVQNKFTGETAYFDHRRLSERPLSVLSLELVLLENYLLAELLNSLSENKE
ncbi:hypothetical protein DXT99_19935 [Pontibacter diazotrophicus]|uniref:Gliding motility-associated protein GldM N-terminal domain-containing protein n=1 Tax=Pontibacter diazotrophicus TaxID=1400979 RepID=A0A3D8L7E5_9BACT|nr:hypothetical protein [Pontibacter diazotrophicus]RDV13294.1 hypothetical protein DXT99_19935 [Pontibacter diazotrophicus]